MVIRSFFSDHTNIELKGIARECKRIEEFALWHKTPIFYPRIFSGKKGAMVKRFVASTLLVLMDFAVHC